MVQRILARERTRFSYGLNRKSCDASLCWSQKCQYLPPKIHVGGHTGRRTRYAVLFNDSLAFAAFTRVRDYDCIVQRAASAVQQVRRLVQRRIYNPATYVIYYWRRNITLLFGVETVDPGRTL